MKSGGMQIIKFRSMTQKLEVMFCLRFVYKIKIIKNLYYDIL